MCGPRRLAEQLHREGYLDPEWREAFRQVRREDFLPDLLWVRDGRGYRPLNRRSAPDEWRELAYRDVPLVTRVEDASAEVALVPSSSASMPRLVAGMLGALRVEPGHRVLELGTGTGFNAALLSHRLGGDRVTSVEADPGLAAAARARLEAAGHSPALRTGDGSRGAPAGAPYDRILATYALHRVPHALVRQVVPGGHLVLPWGTGLYNGVLVRLTVEAGAPGPVAHGPVLGDCAFMWDRGQAPQREVMAVVRHRADAAAGTTSLDPREVLGDENAAFAAGAAVPGCRQALGPGEDGAWTLWLADPEGGSWASLEFVPGARTYEVLQYGPRRLWDEVAAAHGTWVRAGRPHRSRFGLTVHAGGQHLWLDAPGRPFFPGTDREP